MNGAILCLDKVPNSCSECICFSDHYSDMCCKAMNNRTINYPYPGDFRQEWCPLITEIGVIGVDDHIQYSEFVSIKEFQNRVLDCINSEELDKFFNSTVFADKPECRQAMIHGMCIASMLINDCS